MKIDKRKIIQLTTAVIYNLNFYGFKNANIYNGPIKKLCVPGLNCYSCPGAIAACPLGSFQNFIMQKKGPIGVINRFPFYILGLIILFGVIFGRVVCGFLCPFGLYQEILYKIRTKKVKKNIITKNLTIIKYIILIIFAVFIPIIYHYPAFCKFICPAGTLEAGIFHISANDNLRQLAGSLFNLKLSILILLSISSIFIYRTFCRFICPLGAIYSFFNKYAILGLQIDDTKCTKCNKCINVCLMDVKRVGDKECIQCGECIKKCHVNAIYRLKSYK